MHIFIFFFQWHIRFLYPYMIQAMPPLCLEWLEYNQNPSNGLKGILLDPLAPKVGWALPRQIKPGYLKLPTAKCLLFGRFPTFWKGSFEGYEVIIFNGEETVGIWSIRSRASTYAKVMRSICNCTVLSISFLMAVFIFKLFRWILEFCWKL